MKKLVLLVAALMLAIAPSTFGQQTFNPPTVYAGATSGNVVWTGGTINNGGHGVAVSASNTTGLSTTASQGDCSSAFSACNFVYAGSTGTVAVTTTLSTAAAAGNTLLAFVETSGGTPITNISYPWQSSLPWLSGLGLISFSAEPAAGSPLAGLGAVLTGGAGGATNSGTTTAGAGGVNTITGGVGGAGNSTGSGGAGGADTLAGGVGGASVSTGTSGAGGAINLTGGVSGATASGGTAGTGGAFVAAGGAASTTAGTSGVGGAASVTAGAGSPNTGSAGTAGAGGAASLVGGGGGAASSGAATGGAGGTASVTGGAGGGTITGGAGGAVTLAGGAGANGSTAGGNGGNISINGGAPGTGGSPTRGYTNLGTIITNCGSSASCASPAIINGNLKVAIGTQAMSGSTTVSLTGIAPIQGAFTSATSYACVASDANGHAYTSGVEVTSASAITLVSGTSNSDTWIYVCVGY